MAPSGKIAKLIGGDSMSVRFALLRSEIEWLGRSPVRPWYRANLNTNLLG